ncbi:hypothetical protein CDL15_Pgr011860 [Punica granatum]|uniref:Protein EFFECTOR OF TRANSCRIPTION 2-like n=1 Tax=Punica granatum TaxID=22663 RepID=A0A218XEE4_PUNGR|nr:hypothetical protein CDL15_Pgr011860 [Punica granatum]
MAARRDNTTVAVTGARPKREDCGRTKHDSAFSDWKLLNSMTMRCQFADLAAMRNLPALIGPSDWEDYSLGKEGSARYRVHNLPPSSSPGVYELGIAVTRTKSARETRKLNPSNIIIVYTGQADGVRTRLQQYGRSGAHLGNCSSTARANDDSQSTVSHKELGLFREILSRDYSIVFRWAPMNNKGDALGMEAELLKTFDYAWNKGSNGARRPHDILQKLEEASSTAYRVSRTSKKLLPFLQEKGGIRIHGRLPLDTKTVAHAEEENNFFNGIFKFNRSNPRVVLDRSCFNEDETGFCGVYLGNRNICKRPPVKGRKRCAEHKGMKVNAQPWSEVPDQHGITDPGLKNLTFHVEKVKFGSVSLSAGESFTSVICGFIMGDGSSCKRPPVQGRQRCSEHKGRRIVTLNSVSSRNQEINYVQNKGHNISENFQVGKLGLLYSSETCNVRSNTMTVCGVLIGPSDWEDYSLGKEGSARYRVHNLPPSSSPGLYELGTAVTHTKSARETRKLDPSYIIVVYIGQADCVRTRLQQYGRSGAHLGNCFSTARVNDDSQSTCSNKQLGLFREILSRDYSIVFRWAPMNNKGEALRMEALLLNTFDYAWNKGSNGARRPHDILRKIEEASSAAYRVSSTLKKLFPFLQKKVGIRIHGRLPFDTKTAAHAEEENNFFNGIFKFNRSNPRVVLDRSCFNEDETRFCRVYLGNGNICKRPPVKGRKRCAEHKGMKVNARPWSEVPDQHGITDPGLKNLTFHVEKVNFGSVNLSAGESLAPVICGFIMGDGSSCKRPPVQGRKRCSEHKGRRIVTLNFRVKQESRKILCAE